MFGKARKVSRNYGRMCYGGVVVESIVMMHSFEMQVSTGV